MQVFDYHDGTLHCDAVPLDAISRQYGTPTYVYSQTALEASYRTLDEALAGIQHLICYSLKANSNLAVAKVLADAGAGADVVSGGELYRAMKVGIPAGKIVFAGVGKTLQEIEDGLRYGILMFNVESEPELDAIEQTAAAMNKVAPIALRVNPDIDPHTHPYIATGMRKYKFGISTDQVAALYERAAKSPYLDPIGIQMHVGSQLVDLQPVVDGATKMYELARRLGTPLRYFDVGGGLGICYCEEEPQKPDVIARAVGPLARELGCTLVLEPGRFLVGNAGVLLTRVLYIKDNGLKKFAIVDAGMNDLIRPSLYEAYHAIVPVQARNGVETIDVVGPICESGDFFAHDREMPKVAAGDLLAIKSAGAYGFSMASNYNTRPRPAEVLVSGHSYRLVRKRETYEDLVSLEEV